MASKANVEALCQQRQEQVETLEASSTASKLELELAQAASAALTDELRVVRSELSDLSSAREQLLSAQKEAARLQLAAGEANARSGSLEEQLALLQIEAAASAKLNVARIGSLEAALQKSSDEVAELGTLKHGMESLQAVFAEAEAAMRAKQALHERNETDLRSEIADLRSNLDAVQRERANKETELTLQIDALRNNRERLLQEAAAHDEEQQASIARLTAKLEAVEAAGDVKQLELLSRIDSLQRAQVEAESERAALDSVLRAEIGAMRSSRDVATQEHVRIQATLQASFDALRAELDAERASKEQLSCEHAETLRERQEHKANAERVRVRLFTPWPASTCPAREFPSQSACWQDVQLNQLQQDYDALRTELYRQAAALVSEKAASAEAAAVLAEKVPFVPAVYSALTESKGKGVAARCRDRLPCSGESGRLAAAATRGACAASRWSAR